METLDERRECINAIIDTAAKQLAALKCPYFIATIDRDTRDPDGGKVFVSSEVVGPDMQIIFRHAFPADKDIAHLGLWIGGEIMRRNKEANINWVKNKRNGKKTN